MDTSRPSKDEIFNAAAEITDADERASYIARACGNDSELRAEIEELLKHDEAEDSLLDRSAPGLSATIDQPLTEKPGTQIGPYKLLDQIGVGGMGVVYMAEQKKPVRRRVALKIIKPGMDTRQVIARFEAERQALALMDHPNIAKVLDAGATDSGRPFFVMELVNGIPITQYADEQHLTPRERVELFVPVCQAVQHAHQKGIIHRDLKPSNILVALYDSRPVPKVIDFGVAKATNQSLTEATLFTQLGQIVGTLEYMSPEQSQRNQLDVDTRSDVYSLGVVLYELLTGTIPFERQRLRSAAFEEMLRIIREEEPPRPSTRLSTVENLPSVAANRRMEPLGLRKLLRGELDWIVMKALEKDRARRYETASGLAADVQRFLDNEAVVACPPSPVYRFRKFASRNRAAVVTLLSMGLVLLLGIIGTSWQAWRATRAERLATESAEEATAQRDRALVAEREAVTERDQTRRERRVADGMRLAAQSQSVRQKFPVRSVLLAVEAVEATRHYGEPVLPIAHETVLKAVADIGGMPLVGHKAPVSRIARSPDNRWLVTGGGANDTHLWDLSAADPALASRSLPGHSRSVHHLEISRDGRRLVTASRADGTLLVWDLTAEEKAKPLVSLAGLPSSRDRITLGPNGRWLATLGRDERDAHLRDLDSREPDKALTLKGESETGGRVAISPDGRWLVRECGISAQLWDLTAVGPTMEPKTWRVDAERTRQGNYDNQVFISNNSRWLATAGYGTTALLWDLSKAGERFVPIALPHSARVQCVHLTPDSRWLVTAFRESMLNAAEYMTMLWDLTADDPSASPIRLDYSTGIREPFASSRDGRWLAATLGGYVTTGVWDLRSGGRTPSCVVQGGVRELSSDGSWLATAKGNSTLIWDLTVDNPASHPIELRGHEGSGITSAVISEDNHWLVTIAREDFVPRLWNLRADNPASQLTLPTPGDKLQASRDSHWLFAGGFNPNRTAVWDVGSSIPALSPTTVFPHRFSVSDTNHSVAIGASGRWMATVGEDSAYLWDLSKKDPFSSPMVFAHKFARAVALSHDERWLVSAGGLSTGDRQYGDVRLWDLHAEDPTATPVVLKGHERSVDWIGMSPDNRWLVTAGYAGSARLWDLMSDDPGGTARVFGEGLRSISMSPDGRWFVTGGTSGIAHAWELTNNGPSKTPLELRHDTFGRGSDHIWANTWSPDGSWLATAGDAGVVYVWDFRSLDPARSKTVLRGHVDSVRSAAFSPDNRWLATANSYDGVAILWDLDGKSPTDTAVFLRDLDLWTVAITRDGRWLVTGSQKSTHLWDLNLDSLLSRARTLAGRKLTPEERKLYMLGDSSTGD